MRALAQQLQRRAETRLPALTRFRHPEPLPIELHRRRIYIVPTGFGLGFGVLLLVMLLGSLNYNNNAALLLTCLLGAASLSSMLLAFRVLDGIALNTISAGHAVAGQPIDLHLFFTAARPRESIRLDVGDQRLAFLIDTGGETAVAASLPTHTRGWQPLPRIRVWSTWPIGTFRAWSWLYPQQSVLVWPQAERQGPAPHAPEDDPRQPRLHRGDELATLREYRIGDPQRHIAWKASARHDGLMVKDFEQPQAMREWHLDWREIHGLDHEARIARLARWLGEAHAERRRYSLSLPGQDIAAGSGADHYALCMNALAQLP